MKMNIKSKTALCGGTIITLGTACGWLVYDKIKNSKIIKKLQLALAERNLQLDEMDFKCARLRKENKNLRNRRRGVSI